MLKSSSSLVSFARSLFCLALTVDQGDCIFFTDAEISVNVWVDPLSSITANQTIRIVTAILEADETGTVNFEIISLSKNKYGNKDPSSESLTIATDTGCPDLGVQNQKNGNKGLIFVRQMSRPSSPINQNRVAGPNQDYRHDCDYTVVADLLPNEGQTNRLKQRGRELVHVKSARVSLQITVISNTKEAVTTDSRSNNILSQGKNDIAELQNEEICFDGLNKLMLQVFENSPRTSLASFGFSDANKRTHSEDESERTSVQYSVHVLNSEKKILKIKEIRDNAIAAAKFDLWTCSDLDKEYLTEYIFKITCKVSTKNKTEIFELPGSLRIFDENDNGPIWSPDQLKANKSVTSKTLYFEMDNVSVLESRRLQPNEGYIAFSFYDKDTSGVNNYQSYIINDTRKLLEISVTNHDIDYPPTNTSTKITLIVLQAVLKKIPIHGWDGYYCVSAIFKDYSIVGATEAQISFTLCLYYNNRIGSKYTLRNNNRSTIDPDKVKTNSRKTRVSATSNRNNLDLEGSRGRTGEIIFAQDVAICDSVCINRTIGSAVPIIIVFMLGIILKVYLKFKRDSKGHQKCQQNDIEWEELPAFGINRRPIVPLQVWPIENGTVFSIVSDIQDGGNSCVEGKLQQLPLPEANEDSSVESRWVIQPSSITIKSVVGKGNFGQVCHAVYENSTGLINSAQAVDVAVKLFKESKTQSPRESLLIEYESLKDLSHPHVVKLIGVVFQKSVQSSPQDLLVLEYAELQSLKNFLEKCRLLESHSATPSRRISDIWSKRFSENFQSTIELKQVYSVTMEQIMDFSLQIADGMEYISRMRIVHRDLAARNILLTSSKVCKITDFGLSRDVYLDDAYVKLSDETVPAKWLAPECFAVRQYTYQSDVWAFGILLWELATKGMNPYQEEQVDPLYLYQYLFQGRRLTKPLTCSDQFYAVMLKCWDFEPPKRPSFKELVQMLTDLNSVSDMEMEISMQCNEQYFDQLMYQNQQSQIKAEVESEERRISEVYYNDDGVQGPFAWNIGYGYDVITEETETVSLDSDGVTLIADFGSYSTDPTPAYIDTDRNAEEDFFEKEDVASEDENTLIYPQDRICTNDKNEAQRMDEYCSLLWEETKAENVYYNDGLDLKCPRS